MYILFYFQNLLIRFNDYNHMAQKTLTPWRNLSSIDPFLTLSNYQLDQNYTSGKKAKSQDRFMNQSSSIKCKLNFQIDHSIKPPQNRQISQALKRKGQKQKNYQSALSSSLKSSFQPSYQPKIKRGGYLDFYMNFTNDQSSDNTLPRVFPKTSYKILNAPKLKDDFYTNLLDWSKQDIISVVLDNAAYIWPSKGNDAQKLIQGYISSIKWGKGLAIGQETGRIRIIDVQKRKEMVRSKNHLARIGVMDISINGNEIASGSKDSEMIIWDIRQKDACLRFEGHQQQICGLKWSSDNSLLASGGNDNLVFIWDPRMGKYIGKLTEHTAAVKALAWSPHRNSILATGGGSTDKSIKLWNTTQMTCIKSIDSGSQVCNMLFSSSTNELVTTHGYSLNSIMLWNAKNMQKLATLQGHSYRVLYMAKSPDEQSILTGSGDQTLRFWKLFPSSKNDVQSNSCLQPRNNILR